jgi:predicted transcriptional regulator
VSISEIKCDRPVTVVHLFESSYKLENFVARVWFVIGDKTMSFVKDYMSRDFKIIRGDFSPQNAMELLTDSSFGVIENADQQAICVVTMSEIKAAMAQRKTDLMHDLPDKYILQVGQDVEMQAVVDSPLLTTLVETNALVTNGANDIVGVLTKAEIQQFVNGGKSHEKGVTLEANLNGNLGGERLAGDFRPLMAYYICRECRYRNALDAEQVEVINGTTNLPSCQNPDPAVQPHILKRSR